MARMNRRSSHLRERSLGSAEHPPDRPSAAFYCVADERYFLGAVGMINSLRLLGHAEPVFVLDCGLRREQRELLERETIVVAAPTDAPPYLLKTIAPLCHPAEVMVLIDADMVATRPLTELIELASEGRVVAFEDRPHDRFFAEWGKLGLGPARRRRYVNAGLVCLGGDVGGEVLRLLDEHQRHVDFELTFWRRNVRDYPFRFGDQDVLNAILATRVGASRVVALPERLGAQPEGGTFFPRLHVRDLNAIRCADADGTEPYVLHQSKGKPWLRPMYHGIYSSLLARLLLGEDVALRVSERDVPLRMRPGFLARLERTRVNMQQRVRWRVRAARGAARLRTRVRAWPGRHEG